MKIDVAMEMNNTPAGGGAMAVNASKSVMVQPDRASGSAAVEDRETIKRMVEAMQEEIFRMNVSLEFSSYGERGEKIAVIVADRQTGEVIREIPAQEIQNLCNKMSELTGIIFNRQV